MGGEGVRRVPDVDFLGVLSRPQKEVQYNPEVTRTLKEKEKQFELAGNSSYQGINLREIFIKRKKI